MSKNKDRVESSSTVTAVTAKEKRSGYGRRNTDLTPYDTELLGELEKGIQECIIKLEHAYERMERNQEEFDRLKSESGIMIDDTQQIISTFQVA
ncbi:MAG TPA: hypothetical protein VK619_11525 [Pyrinomonadaceae bacterium]|nr:hypothetical protein [Pyrinomonadaceae bacterium]